MFSKSSGNSASSGNEKQLFRGHFSVRALPIFSAPSSAVPAAILPELFRRVEMLPYHQVWLESIEGSRLVLAPASISCAALIA